MCGGSPIWKFSITKHLAGLLSEASLVHLAHLEGDTPKPEGSSQMPQGPTLDTPTGNPMEGDAIVAPIYLALFRERCGASPEVSAGLERGVAMVPSRREGGALWRQSNAKV
jgi:hypothetical protein